MNEETLFREALARPAAERAAFLDAACAGQPQLRAAVDALLAAQEASANQPGAPAQEPPSAAPQATPPRVPGSPSRLPIEAGTVLVGRYTLLEKYCEDELAEVWVAQQSEPVQRQVTLKLLKAGLNSKAVQAAFEQERQMLALLDHPQIARLLDSGLTEEGRPFFVTELVNGPPLTTFCDEVRLTPQARLELFVPICQAVQHAHQKGLVHRNLEPANIRVTLVDGRTIPKVVGFGLARARGKLPEEALSTSFDTFVATLEYPGRNKPAPPGRKVDAAGGRLRPGRHPVRTAHRAATAGRQTAEAGGVPRDDSPSRRRRPGAAEHPPGHGGVVGVDGGAAAAAGTARAARGSCGAIWTRSS